MHDCIAMRPVPHSLLASADPPSGAKSLVGLRDCTPAGAGRPRAKRVDSTDLMAGRTEIEIDHGGAIYRLRLTSLGKLLLTK